jgi:hypothetical protein
MTGFCETLLCYEYCWVMTLSPDAVAEVVLSCMGVR